MALANTGRKRLSLLLCGTSGVSCFLLMVIFVLVYGTPYNPMWWAIMALVLIAATVLPLALVSAIEWVIEGYRNQPSD